MTKYEKARIIGLRALQISMNAPLMISIDNNATKNDLNLNNQSSLFSTGNFTTSNDPLSLAERELYEKTIPFKIRRYLPDGNYEEWNISEMNVD